MIISLEASVLLYRTFVMVLVSESWMASGVVSKSGTPMRELYLPASLWNSASVFGGSGICGVMGTGGVTGVISGVETVSGAFEICGAVDLQPIIESSPIVTTNAKIFFFIDKTNYETIGTKFSQQQFMETRLEKCVAGRMILCRFAA